MLDDKKLFEKIDPGDMVKLLESFPGQLPEGRRIATETNISGIDPGAVANIVVCGMGGSAIGGDLVRAYQIDRSKVPFYINRDYLLPAFIGKGSLVIGSSYSGNTEETLSCFEEAGRRGAQRIAVTTGGKIAELAESGGIPAAIIPPGLPPRAALGYGFAPILTILERLGFVSDQTEAVEETVELLRDGVERYRIDKPWAENEAKMLATKLHGMLPLIYSDDWHFNAVAVRFRGQINENAKQLAYSALFPENNHNELVGWKHLGALSSLLAAVYLTDKAIHPRVDFRMRFVCEIQEESGIEVIRIKSRGAGLLARMFSLIQMGDWTSYYTAILNEEDPMPVAIIDKLKMSLSQFKQ